MFCGSQSAGKSSALESITGITFPRAEGTCTRCPIEARLKKGDKKWTANIKLRIVEDSERNDIQVSDVDFASCERPELELFIQKAQKAVLNPNSVLRNGVEYFLKYNFELDEEEESNALKFTKNVVVVEILNDKIDLTLVDLPGMIQSTEKKDDGLGEQINEMILEYMGADCALIVAVVSCKDDPENQPVISMAAKVDPTGIRTIGLLTKPDTIEDGCFEIYKAIMNGRKLPLENGYYIMKSPSKKEREESQKTNEEIEKHYFSKSNEWRNINQARIGAKNFRDDLSEKLIDLIKTQMPTLSKDITKKFGDALKEKEALPPAPKNPIEETITLSHAFFKEFDKSVKAQESGTKAMFHEVEKLILGFVEQIWDLEPNFQPEGDVEDVFLNEKGLPISKSIPYSYVDYIIKNERGNELPDSISSTAVDVFLRPLYERFKALIFLFLDDMEKLLWKYVMNYSESTFSMYSGMNFLAQEKFKELHNDLLKKTQNQLTEYATSLILNSMMTFNKSRFTTIRNDGLFSSSVSIVDENGNEVGEMKDEKHDSPVWLSSRVLSAFKIRAEAVIEAVPPMVYKMLFMDFVENCNTKLVCACTKEGVAESIIFEDKKLAEKREEIESRIARLSKANKALCDFKSRVQRK